MTMNNEELTLKIQAGERAYIADLWEQNIRLFQVKAYSLYTRFNNYCISSGITMDDILAVISKQA